jgi:hypothetical protein
MLLVVGLRFGKVTRSPFDQSTYGVLSVFAGSGVEARA